MFFGGVSFFGTPFVRIQLNKRKSDMQLQSIHNISIQFRTNVWNWWYVHDTVKA